MAFRKTNKIDKADHKVVEPTKDDLQKSAALREDTWDQELRARIAAELEARDPKE